MDTQTPFQSPQSTPPVSPTPPQNKRWEIILGSIIILIIIVTAGYFVFVKNNLTSPNTPPPQIAEETPAPQNDNQQIKNYTVGDVRSAYLSRSYANSSNFYVTDDKISLTDGIGTFSYCEGNQTCDISKTKKGTVTLSNITAPSDPALLGDLDWGGTGGAMILTLDLGNQKPKEYYLSRFDLNKQEGENRYTIYIFSMKNLGTLSGTIKNIEIVNKGEVTLNLQTPSGIVSRTFSITAGRRYYDLTELTPDRTGKIYDDQKLGYTFVYPKNVNVSYGQTLRATVMENDLKTSPIYYAQECGLQPSFADNTVPFWSSMTSADGQSSVNLSATLTAHKVASQTLYLTSALYGYDPADWGKIKQQVSIQTYLNDVKSGSPITGRKVTLENIGGVSVKHIMPFSIGRPCDDQNREQYQWVKVDLFFNLIFTDSKTQPASTEQKSALINSIFSSLKLK